MLTSVYRGKIRLLKNGKPFGKPFYVDSESRQEIYKDPKSYFGDLLTSVNG